MFVLLSCSSPFVPLVPFSLLCPGDPGHLHSFPTRRSSDLFRRAEEAALRELLRGAPRPLVVALGGGTLEREGTRSEEHTSELQSPCNLVCRLLLEKKNIMVNTKSRLKRRRDPSSGDEGTTR